MAVLISIRREWAKLIFSGRKTVEVRKTRPAVMTPFKVYVYETFGERKTLDVMKDGDKGFFDEIYHGKTIFIKAPPIGRGLVIGEFTCSAFIHDTTAGHDALFNSLACLTEQEASKYANGANLWGWLIKDPVLYERPRKIGEFFRCGNDVTARIALVRPPQSWCYVEQ